MKVIIIIAICLVITYGLLKLFHHAMIYAIIDVEYQQFKKLTFKFPSRRLMALKEDILTAQKRASSVLNADREVYKTLVEQKEKTAKIEFWKTEIMEGEELLARIGKMLDDVERELSRRAFFKSQW